LYLRGDDKIFSPRRLSCLPVCAKKSVWLPPQSLEPCRMSRRVAHGVLCQCIASAPFVPGSVAASPATLPRGIPPWRSSPPPSCGACPAPGRSSAAPRQPLRRGVALGAPGGALPRWRRKNATRRVFWCAPCRPLLARRVRPSQRAARAGSRPAPAAPQRSFAQSAPPPLPLAAPRWAPAAGASGA